MFENIMNFLKKMMKKEKSKESSDTAKERLHLVLMQDRANVSADFLELMRQEIIEVIKKYVDIDEKAIDVHLTNKANDDGTVGAPALYANIPIVTIKNEARKVNVAETENVVENETNTIEKEQLRKEENTATENQSIEEKNKENKELKVNEAIQENKVMQENENISDNSKSEPKEKTGEEALNSNQKSEIEEKQENATEIESKNAEETEKKEQKTSNV